MTQFERDYNAKGILAIRKILQRNAPESEPDTLQEDPRHLFSAGVMGICILIAMIMFLVAMFEGCAQAQCSVCQETTEGTKCIPCEYYHGTSGCVDPELDPTPCIETPTKANSAQIKGNVVEVDIDKIGYIESNNEPLAYNSKSGATGEYQLTEGVIVEWNNRLEVDTIGFWSEHYTLKDMFDPQKSHDVADWFINTKIPEWLNHYKIPDTIKNRLIAYNWGIGHLHHWFKHGSHWNQLPRETRQYIQKYFRKD